MPSRRIPPDQRKRTEMSCDKCKARKQKCHRPLAAPPPSSAARAATLSSSSSSAPAARDDHPRAGLPCRYCQTHNHVCVTTQPRKKRGTYLAPGAALPGRPGPDAAARAVLLEGLVKGLVPGADTATVEGLRALGRALGIPLPDAVADDGTTAAEDAPLEGDDGQASAGDDVDAGQDDVRGGAREEVGDATGPENGLPDCAGQTQYVGANSSYAMQLRVRALLTGVDAPARFFLFAGAPAGAQEPAPSGLRAHAARIHSGPDDPGLLSLHDAGGDQAMPADAAVLAGPVAGSLVAAYFAHLHPAFPILDEAAFRTAYAGFLEPDSAGVDPAWLCSLYCVLLLARPLARGAAGRAPDAEAAWWWRRVQGLLPAVLLASRPAAVAALLLAAAHLNHTNRRDACWTLTGAAARIAVAVGLPPPRPRRDAHLDALWWALCRFEGLQAASLDRPSALEEAAAPAAAPPAPSCPPERALSLLLARACRLARASPGPDPSSTEAAPLAPAAARLLRDLAHWRAALPPGLRRPDEEADSDGSLGGRAAVLRLHVEHQHVLCVAARGALLRRCRGGPGSPLPADDDLAAVAVRAARESLGLLLALADLGEDGAAAALDPYAGWDLYFLYQAALVLGLHVATAQPLPPADPDVVWLGRAAQVAARVEADPRVPGTMLRYAAVVREVAALVQQQQQHVPWRKPSHGAEEAKWPVAPGGPEGGGGAATLMPLPPSHEDMLGVMSQVSFPMASPELAAQFGLVDGGYWMGPREGWGDFLGFGA